MAERKWISPRLFATYDGDKAAAKRMERKARICVGHLFDQLRPDQTYRVQTWRYRDGSSIKAYVWRDVLGERARVEIFAPGDSLLSEEIPLDGGFIVSPVDDVNTYADVYLRTVIYFLGAPESSEVVYYYHHEVARTEITTHTDTDKQAGPISWYGQANGKEAVLSWDHGMASRYRITQDYSLECSGRVLYNDILGDPITAQSGRKGLYYAGTKIDTEHNVVGAGIFNNTLIYVSYVDLSWVADPEDSYNERIVSKANAYSRTATFFASDDMGVTWTTIGVVSSENSFKGPWFFSPNGDKANTVLEWGALRCDVYEASILYSHGVLVVTHSVDSRQYPYPKASFQNIEYTESVIASGAGPEGNRSVWEYGPWKCWHPGTTQFSGELNDLSEISAKTRAWITTFATPYEPAFAELDARVSLINTVTELEADGTYFPAPGCDSHGTPNLGGFAMTVNYLKYYDYFTYMRFQDVRDVLGETEQIDKITTTKPDIALKRLVAVDYSFNGEKLYIEQEFIDDGTEHSINWRQYDRHQGTATASGSHTVHTHFSRSLETYKANMRWELRVNDDVLVTAYGGIIDSDGLPSNSAYTQTLRHDVTTENDLAVSDYGNEWDAGVKFMTERVTLLDMDARTKSVIYTRATVTGEFAGNADVSGNESLYRRGIAKTTNGTRNDYMVVVHEGREIAKQEVPAGSSPGMMTMYERGAALYLMPRMFGKDDLFEGVVPDVLYWGTGLNAVEQWRRWWTQLYDCWPAMRKSGCLTVRDPLRTAYCFTDESVIGDPYGPCWRTPRDITYLGGAVINKEALDIKSEFLTALNEDADPNDPSGELFRFYPIRAI